MDKFYRVFFSGDKSAAEISTFNDYDHYEQALRFANKWEKDTWGIAIIEQYTRVDNEFGEYMRTKIG